MWPNADRKPDARRGEAVLAEIRPAGK